MIPERKSIADYITITSGVLGRLVISTVYFLIVANVLPVADFGVYAAASGVGVVLSRLLAFGFISPVYRAANVRPRLLGVYFGGLGVLGLISLPVLLTVALGVHAMFFGSKIAAGTFLLIIAAEVMGVRVMEFGVITLNGMSRFGAAARLVIVASSLRTVAALAFYFSPDRSLETWVWFNLAAAIAGAVVGIVFFLPRMRLRLHAGLCARRLKDAVLTAASELAFYAQSELDKVLVLSLAGERAAGLYAIAMRLVDLTAIPIRSFNQMAVQSLMRSQGDRLSAGRQIVVESGIAVVSTLGMTAFIVLLWMAPAALGGNVERAAPLLLPMLLIPAFRNLTEYHGELLYARELLTGRLLLLGGLMTVKFALMAVLLGRGGGIEVWAMPLTGVFAVVYGVSAVVTYAQLRAVKT